MTQWQPIETCPPEHVLFHGNTRHDARVVFTGWMGQNGRPYADNGDSVNPTHWMPLPAPPTAPRRLVWMPEAQQIKSPMMARYIKARDATRASNP